MNEDIESKTSKSLRRYIDTEDLTNTKRRKLIRSEFLLNEPIIEHIIGTEKLHYLFVSDKKKYLKLREDGRKTKMHSRFSGQRYLLITDRRVIFLSGSEDGDVPVKIKYDAITEVYSERDQIIIEENDGTGMCFIVDKYQSQVENAVNYIKSNLDKEPGEPEKNADVTSGQESSTESSGSEQTANMRTFGGNGFSINAGISVYSHSEIAGELNKLDEGFTSKGSEKRKSKAFGNDKCRIFYGFTSKADVSAQDSELSIGNINIDYSNILNMRFLTGKDLIADSNSSVVLHDCDYIALTLANGGVPPDQTSTTYEGDVLYVYLIGPPEKIAYYGTVYSGDDTDYEFEITNLPSASKSDLRSLRIQISNNLENQPQDAYTLQDYIERPSHLKVEGWEDSGVTNINAGIDGSTESKGKSSGVQIGPYTSSKSKSEGSITAKIDGSIADSSFSSEIRFLHISESGIFVDSDPVLDFGYEEIDRILPRDSGFTIEVDETAYTVVGPQQLVDMQLGKSGSFSQLDSPDLEDAIRYMQEQASQTHNKNASAEESDSTSANKLRELKKLHDEGILTDDEFESKKEQLLDEF